MENCHSLWQKWDCQEIVQQLAAQIPWGCLLHLLNNKPVESFPKKLKGLLPSPEEIEAELTGTDMESKGG